MRQRVQDAADAVAGRIRELVDMGAERARMLHQERGFSKECAVRCAVRAIVCLALREKT